MRGTELWGSKIQVPVQIHHCDIAFFRPIVRSSMFIV